MISCSPPSFVRNADDGVWNIEHGNVVMVRMDGRRLVEPLRGHQCAACLAELMYLESTEEGAPKRGLLHFKHRNNNRRR